MAGYLAPGKSGTGYPAGYPEWPRTGVPIFLFNLICVVVKRSLICVFSDTQYPTGYRLLYNIGTYFTYKADYYGV